MKKQINPSFKAHLLRGTFYLLLLFAVCVIPFALGQRNTGKRSASGNTTQPSTTSSDSGPGGAPGSLAMPKFPRGGALWDQYNNPATDPRIDISSQDFEPALDASDDQAADDFVLTYPYNL
jgi:hypothetical protein